MEDYLKHKFEDVVMLESNDLTEILFGNFETVHISKPVEIFDKSVLEYLSELSSLIRNSTDTRLFPDLLSFAFWCREKNLNLIRQKYENEQNRLGLGTVLHITPRNVPLNFAFSWAFSALAGNSNLVKLPSVQFPQVELLLQLILKLSQSEVGNKILETTVFFRTGHSSKILNKLSASSEARMIWGSDETIKEIKRLSTPIKHVDLTFSSRFSAAVLSCVQFIKADLKMKELIVRRFLQDSLTFGQRGCSSPRVIYWIGELGEYGKSRHDFWRIANNLAPGFLQLPDSFERFSNIALASTQNKHSIELLGSLYNNLITVEKADGHKIDQLFTLGTFLETRIDCLEEIFETLDNKAQTITYFGINPDSLIQWIKKIGFIGVDRVVPFGAAFDMTPTWDGCDTIRALSRVIEVR